MQEMAKAASPPRFNRGHFYDPNYTAEITSKMQVPKRIRVSGVVDDEEDFAPPLPTWQPERIDMHVPERILVAGDDGHIAAPAPSRELIIENTVMPPDPALIRVQTPPRSITLEEHYFPSADEYFGTECEIQTEVNDRDYSMEETKSSLGQTVNTGEFSVVRSNRPFLKKEDEMVHLRKQLQKMHRRVVNIERDLEVKHSRDKFIVGLATIYFAVKFVMWLNRRM